MDNSITLWHYGQLSSSLSRQLAAPPSPLRPSPLRCWLTACVVMVMQHRAADGSDLVQSDAAPAPVSRGSSSPQRPEAVQCERVANQGGRRHAYGQYISEVQIVIVKHMFGVDVLCLFKRYAQTEQSGCFVLMLMRRIVI